MPNYISLAEQGYKQPGDTIADAARNLMAQRQARQQLEQSAAAFPIEQQQRGAQALESTKKAAVIDKSLALQQKAQELQNQAAQLDVVFRQETDPVRKEQLSQQVEQIKAAIQNLGVQGGLLRAQTGETEARGGLYSAQAATTRLGTASSKVTPGKLDAYGNSITHTVRTDPGTGTVLQEEDTFEKGRGIPRVAYKQVWDNNAGMMKRIPGVVEVDPATGSLNVQFPDDSSNAAEEQNAGPDPLIAGVVDRFFDMETGKRNSKQPGNAKERAQLNSLLRNPTQLNAYALKLESLSTPAAPAVPAKPAVKSAPTKPVAPAAEEDDGESQATPGISSNGSPVKTEETKAKLTTSAPVPIAGAKKTGGTFKELPVGAEFMQGGVKYRKTGDTTAEPVGS